MHERTEYGRENTVSVVIDGNNAYTTRYAGSTVCVYSYWLLIAFLDHKAHSLRILFQRVVVSLPPLMASI